MRSELDDSAAEAATELTSRFYAEVSDSFSKTRSSAWEGWSHMLDLASGKAGQPLRVLDAACGNMRFEKFLLDRGVHVESVCAVDNCPALARAGEFDRLPFPVSFVEADILAALDHDKWPADAGAFDLVVCFGFMHHIPKAEQRRALLGALVESARYGGMIAVSFWQFAKSERLLAKAADTTERAARLHGICIDSENDYLLGWQDEPNAFRYCHNYTEEEIDELVAFLVDGGGVRQVARFSSDGSTGGLNRYVILERLEGF